MPVTAESAISAVATPGERGRVAGVKFKWPVPMVELAISAPVIVPSKIFAPVTAPSAKSTVPTVPSAIWAEVTPPVATLMVPVVVIGLGDALRPDSALTLVIVPPLFVSSSAAQPQLPPNDLSTWPAGQIWRERVTSPLAPPP